MTDNKLSDDYGGGSHAHGEAPEVVPDHYRRRSHHGIARIGYSDRQRPASPEGNWRATSDAIAKGSRRAYRPEAVAHQLAYRIAIGECPSDRYSSGIAAHRGGGSSARARPKTLAADHLPGHGLLPTRWTNSRNTRRGFWRQSQFV